MSDFNLGPGRKMSRQMSRRQFLKRVLTTTLMSAGTIAYGHNIETSWVEVVPVHLTLPNLAPEFHGYRVVQISDIHMGVWMTRDRLMEVVSLVNQHQPDLVAITGDFVTYGVRISIEDLVTPLKALNAPDGVVAVLGNHDYWTNTWLFRQIAHESGIIALINDVYTIERVQAVLNIAGVDDLWKGDPRLDLVLKRLPSTGAAILLVHEPDFADLSAPTERFDLQLSGHSHGGQIVLPFIGPPILPPDARKYPSGLYQVGKMLQYTNRGIGTGRLQIRINCRPEITVFTLASAQVSGDYSTKISTRSPSSSS